MLENEKIRLIESYIDCYNRFDVAGMLELCSDEIIFENESNGEKTAYSEGKTEFKDLALGSLNIFSARKQVVTDTQLTDNMAISSISYTATLAVDLPNGLKAGEVIKLAGKTHFQFHDGKISYIKDIS